MRDGAELTGWWCGTFGWDRGLNAGGGHGCMEGASPLWSCGDGGQTRQGKVAEEVWLWLVPRRPVVLTRRECCGGGGGCGCGFKKVVVMVVVVVVGKKIIYYDMDQVVN